MKRIIFRNPFVTKKDKTIAASYLRTALIIMETVDRNCKTEDGSYTPEGCELILKATELWEKAAKRFGFRNIKDMDEYKERHGHF